MIVQMDRLGPIHRDPRLLNQAEYMNDEMQKKGGFTSLAGSDK